jgi:hypothetical protein
MPTADGCSSATISVRSSLETLEEEKATDEALTEIAKTAASEWALLVKSRAPWLATKCSTGHGPKVSTWTFKRPQEQADARHDGVPRGASGCMGAVPMGNGPRPLGAEQKT